MKFLILLCFLVAYVQSFQSPLFRRCLISTKLRSVESTSSSDPLKNAMKSVSNAIDKAGGASGIMDKSMEALNKGAKLAQDAAAKAKELNEEHHILDKAKDLASKAAEGAKKLNEEYKLTDKAADAAKKAADAAVQKLKDASK